MDYGGGGVSQPHESHLELQSVSEAIIQVCFLSHEIQQF